MCIAVLFLYSTRGNRLTLHSLPEGKVSGAFLTRKALEYSSIPHVCIIVVIEQLRCILNKPTSNFANLTGHSYSGRCPVARVRGKLLKLLLTH